MDKLIQLTFAHFKMEQSMEQHDIYTASHKRSKERTSNTKDKDTCPQMRTDTNKKIKMIKAKLYLV